MDIEDYKRLASFLTRIQGKFLLTINDHETMREVFKEYNVEEVEVTYSIGRDAKSKSRGRYGELLIRNYG